MNITGAHNVAVGSGALYTNSNGSSNVAIGRMALRMNNDRSNIVAVGDSALFNNSIGAVYDPVDGIVEGFSNTAVGSKALYANTRGTGNTALGFRALYNVVNGDRCTGIGEFALGNTTGDGNTGVGAGSLSTNTSGTNNTAVGYQPGPNAATRTNTTALGYQASATSSDQVRLGNSAVTTIVGAVAFTSTSDARYKRNIEENVHGLDFIMKLRPVTYNFDVHKMAAFLNEDMGMDAQGNRVYRAPTPEMVAAREQKEAIRYTGFLAQEVEAAAKRVGYDFSAVTVPEDEGGTYGLAYSEFVVPLVKAVQEQQAQIEQQQQLIEQLRKEVEALRQR